MNEKRDDAEDKLNQHVNYVEFGEALKTGRFWLLSLMLFNGIFYGIYVAAVYKTTA